MISKIPHKRFKSTQSSAALLAISLIAFSSTTVHALDITWDNGGADDQFSTAANWDSNTVPSGTDNALMNIGGTVTYDDGQTNSMYNAFIEGGTIFDMSGGTFNATLSGNSVRFVVGRNGTGTINQSGGTMGIGHLIAIGWGDVGDYNLSGGTLNVSRAGNTLQGSSANASISLGPSSGAGTLNISGGALTTRAGIEIGTNAVFKVSGSQATEIGIGSNGSGDGYWNQLGGATLSVGVDLGGLTKIFVDDVQGTSGNFATFESGSLLDVDYYNDGYGGGTWTVLELENADIVDNGLAFASGVDSGIWSFAIDNSGANGILTVTAAGAPAGIFGNWFQIEAEDRDSQSGTQLETTSDTGGGQNVSHITNGNWCLYENVTLGDNALLNFRVARNSGTDAGHIEVRQGSTTGTLIAQIDVPETGGWQSWETISVPVVTTVTGQQDIYLVFVETSTSNNGTLFNLNWWSKTAMVDADEQTAVGGHAKFETTQDIGGGQNLGWITDGEWMEYTIEVETTGLHKIDLRVAGDNSDGSINIVSGGQVIGSAAIGDTGGWQVWETVSAYVEFDTVGIQTLRLEFVVPSAGFNFNWFSYEVAPEPIAITVGNTLKQQMRYGVDYERLWFWTGTDAQRDEIAQWTVDDCDVDYVRVAINAKYELTEGDYQEDAYFDADDSEGGGTSNDRIIPMMQDMQAANPDIKFFASPRPLNEAVSGVAWQPYPQWITGSTGTNSNFNFDEVKCSEYLIRYLILMKHHGFKITYMDLTNEWNVLNAQDVRDIRLLFDQYLDGTIPVVHPDYPLITLTEDDFPLLVAPSAWSYTQGRSWLSGVIYNSYRDALDIASCHNTDKGGTAQDFIDRLEEKYATEDRVPEAWNTEVHGWKSTSNADEVLTFAYMMECINAGFSGLSGWLAVGTPNQGHSYIVNKARSVKYYIFKKLTNTSHRGFALDVNEPDEFKDYWDSDPDQQDADSAVSALIRGNLMTVWVLNHSDKDHLTTITPTGRTISDEPIKFTRWSQFDGLSVEGVTGSISKTSDTTVYANIQDNSAYCYEILLEPETVPYTHIEAESYDSSNPASFTTEACADTNGGLNITDINDGDWTRYNDIDLNHAATIRLRVAAPSGQAEGKIEVRIGSETGTLIGRVAVPVTGGWQTWCTIEAPLDPTAGTHDLYLKYVEAKSNPNASGAMFNLNWFEIEQSEAPSSLTESPLTGTQVTLSWNTVPGAIGYTVKRSTTQGGPYAEVDDTVTETTYIDTGLNPGVSYYYVLVARYGNDDESDESSEVVAVPSDPIDIENISPSAPAFNQAGDNVRISIQNSGQGHMHQGQEKLDLTDNTDWIDVGDPQAGNAGSLEFDFPVSPTDTECFYRIKIWRQ